MRLASAGQHEGRGLASTRVPALTSRSPAGWASLARARAFCFLGISFRKSFPRALPGPGPPKPDGLAAAPRNFVQVLSVMGSARASGTLQSQRSSWSLARSGTTKCFPQNRHFQRASYVNPAVLAGTTPSPPRSGVASAGDDGAATAAHPRARSRSAGTSRSRRSRGGASTPVGDGQNRYSPAPRPQATSRDGHRGAGFSWLVAVGHP